MCFIGSICPQGRLWASLNQEGNMFLTCNCSCIYLVSTRGSNSVLGKHRNLLRLKEELSLTSRHKFLLYKGMEAMYLLGSNFQGDTYTDHRIRISLKEHLHSNNIPLCKEDNLLPRHHLRLDCMWSQNSSLALKNQWDNNCQVDRWSVQSLRIRNNSLPYSSRIPLVE